MPSSLHFQTISLTGQNTIATLRSAFQSACPRSREASPRRLEEMDQVNSWTLGFGSLDCITVEPSPFGLCAYAELGDNIYEADCFDKAVTDR